MGYRWLVPLALPLFIVTAVAYVVDLRAPPPTASVALGTEAVFGSGLHEREQARTAIRWTRERAVFTFSHLPRGRGSLSVEVRGHRDWVTVVADGRALGTMAPGETTKTFPLSLDAGRTMIELHVRSFTAGGRALGAQLGHVTVIPPPGPSLDPHVWLAFVVPSLLAAAAAYRLGTGLLGAVAASVAIAAAEAALWMPWGLVRSRYVETLALGLSAGVVVAAGLAHRAERRWTGAGRWAMAAALLALLVQGAAATWPAMIVSDAVLHAHNLEKVSAGDLWLTSRTQHAPPFEFPYGVSFYGLLVPFHRAGLEAVTLVRVGAALSGLVASAALFGLLAPQSAVAAAAAVVALQLLPATFDLYSYGNLSNVFGQAMTVLFFACWARPEGRRAVAGALWLFLAALGHLSSMIVLAVLVAALFVARRGWGEVTRGARYAVIAAGVLAVAYYAAFLPLMMAQASRLLEGGTPGGATISIAERVSGQGAALIGQWGLPALVLAFVGRPRRREGTLSIELLAFWGAGAALAVLALVSPIEVRYLYALTLPLAIATGRGVLVLTGRGAAGRVLLLTLAAVQIALALRNLQDDLYFHYRL